MELRYDSHTTIIASQFTPDGWHKNLGGGAIADAILDRIVSSSYTIHIKGDKSMRTRKRINKKCHYGQIYSDYFYIIGIWFRLADKCLKQILTISKIKSNAPALLYFSACKNVTRYIIS